MHLYVGVTNKKYDLDQPQERFRLREDLEMRGFFTVTENKKYWETFDKPRVPKSELSHCPCHYRSVGFKNPPNEHCPECPKFNKLANVKRLMSPQHQRSVLAKKIDDCVSLVVRIRGEWTCVKCHNRYPPVISRRTGLPAQNLMTTSHYFGRGRTTTKWDTENLDPMDIFCHQKVENHKTEDVEGFNYEKYMIDKLGPQKFEILRLKHEMTGGYTITELELLLADYQKQLKVVIELYANNY